MYFEILKIVVGFGYECQGLEHAPVRKSITMRSASPQTMQTSVSNQ